MQEWGIITDSAPHLKAIVRWFNRLSSTPPNCQLQVKGPSPETEPLGSYHGLSHDIWTIGRNHIWQASKKTASFEDMGLAVLCRHLTAIPRGPCVPQNKWCKDPSKCIKQLVRVATFNIQSRRALHEHQRSVCTSEAPHVPKADWIHKWHRSDRVRLKHSSHVACIWVPISSYGPAEFLRLTSWLSHQWPHVTEENSHGLP